MLDTMAPSPGVTWSLGSFQPSQQLESPLSLCPPAVNMPARGPCRSLAVGPGGSNVKSGRAAVLHGARRGSGCSPVQLSPQPLVLAHGHGARPLLLLQSLPLSVQNLLPLVQLCLMLHHVLVPVGGEHTRWELDRGLPFPWGTKSLEDWETSHGKRGS